MAAVALAATVFTACGDDDDPVPEAAQSPTTSSSVPLATTAPPSPIVIRDFSFSNLEAKAGSRILVQNTGQQVHTLTAQDNRFDTGQIQPGRNVELSVPSVAGTYRVRCTIHPDRMTGELKVS